MLACVLSVSAAACTGSERVDLLQHPDGSTGVTGTAGTGSAGTGAAGTGNTGGTGGAAGSTVVGSGTGGAAGSAATGTAGSSASGLAGTSGAGVAGSGPLGTAGSSGAPGTAGSSGGARDAGADRGTGAAGTTGSADAAGSAGTSGAGGGAASGDAGADDAGALGYVALHIENVLLNACGGCHFDTKVPAPMGGFSFTYANLLGPVTAAHAGCPNLDASKRRVVPGHPEFSLLYIKASLAKPPAACGGHMPYMGQDIAPNVLAYIRDWILQGAKP
jgi:hypothetical protein